MSFEEDLRNWVHLDNQQRIYTEKINEIKDKKEAIKQKLLGGDESFGKHVHNKSIEISDGR